MRGGRTGACDQFAVWLLLVWSYGPDAALLSLEHWGKVPRVCVFVPDFDCEARASTGDTRESNARRAGEFCSHMISSSAKRSFNEASKTARVRLPLARSSPSSAGSDDVSTDMVQVEQRPLPSRALPLPASDLCLCSSSLSCLQPLPLPLARPGFQLSSNTARDSVCKYHRCMYSNPSSSLAT